MRTVRCLSPLLLALALGACAGEERPAPPRHVLLITVDTLRADHTSLHGYGRDTSPRIAELARGGVRFDQAIAQWPKTGASFASIFTGRYPQSTGLIQRAALRVPESYLTLPELFQEAGFTTLAVVSNAVIGARFGWDDGFDEFHQTWGEGEHPEDALAFRPLIQAPRVNALALPLLARHAGAGRLFAWIHYTDPHAPYVLPAGEENPFLGDRLFTGDERVPPRAARGYRMEARDDRRYYVAQYDANVRVADRHIGELLGRARELGLLDDALVVVTADHGESLGEHGSWFEHGPLPYNTTARVPLVIAGKGIASGAVVSRPVELVDLFPTLRELALPARAVDGLEGRSLVPLLAGSAAGEAAAAFRHAFSEAGERPRYYRSVQDGAWKLVQGIPRGRRAAARPARFELYDLRADPLEERDLAAQRPDEVRRLRRELLGWASGSGPPAEAGAPGEDAEKALRALGYAN